MNNLRTFEEYTDYRNVTGFGSMGQSSAQQSGPSFNKGPDSATYNRPDVIGTEVVSMEDPYFGEQRSRRKLRGRKNKYIDKLRKDKTKYLRSIDRDTLKKKANESLDKKLYKKVEKPEPISRIYSECGQDKSKLCDYLNKRYAGKMILLYEEVEDNNSAILIPIEFKEKEKEKEIGLTPAIEDTYQFCSFEFDKPLKDQNKITNCHISLSKDYICEMEKHEPLIRFTEEDPYGEEDWSDD